VPAAVDRHEETADLGTADDARDAGAAVGFEAAEPARSLHAEIEPPEVQARDHTSATDLDIHLHERLIAARHRARRHRQTKQACRPADKPRAAPAAGHG
jgi:hypothetical protein